MFKSSFALYKERRYALKRSLLSTVFLHIGILLLFAGFTFKNTVISEAVAAKASPDNTLTMQFMAGRQQAPAAPTQPSGLKKRETADSPAAETSYQQPQQAAVAANNNTDGREEAWLTELIGRLGRSFEKYKHYPLAARRAGVEGEALLYVTLDTEGRITAAYTEGELDARLDAALKKSVGQFVAGWQWNSEPLREAVTVTMPIKYVLH
jgi:TonB family protein